MGKMWHLGLAMMLVLVVFSSPCSSEDKKPADSGTQEKERAEEGVGLTIYSQPAQTNQGNYYAQQRGYYDRYGRWNQTTPGYAVVKEWRKINLNKGQNTLRFQDVAATIDATTVHFKSLTDPDNTYVIEQNYKYDLVNEDKILQKYIDKKVDFTVLTQTMTGILLSVSPSGLIVRTNDEKYPIQVIDRSQVRKFRALPGGLITKPTLVWLIDAVKAGQHLAKVTYQASNITWNSDYTLVIAQNDKSIDLSGWVTINNNTGTAFNNAELKLVAGDVHRVARPGEPLYPGVQSEMKRSKARDEAGFAEKSFFEYHLYTLGRRTSIPNASMKQLELFNPVDNVPSQKVFVYNGAKGMYYYGLLNTDNNFGMTSNKKVDIYLEFDNKKELGLGIPLPAGKVRVYKKDEADGSLEFIGEDAIDHTPKDEKVRLMMGNAFDIVGERVRTDFKINHDQDWMIESFEIKVRNHKEEDIEVLVKEGLYRWVNWEITQTTDDYKKLDAHNIHFPVKIPKGEEKVIKYTVKYTW